MGDTICEDESAELIATGMVDRFTWLDESGTALSTGDTLIYDTEIDQTILVVGKLGLCEEDSVLVSVVVQPTIDVTLGTTEYELFINSAEIVDIDFDETDDYGYSWSPASGLSCDDCANPKISDIGQQMHYTLIVTDNTTGCDLEKTIFVRFINQCSDEAFYIPNIFSPNGDGSNDYFQILSERPEEFNEIRLFDRWGNHIYVSTDVLGRWDGNFQGKPVSTGVYLYMINYTCSDTGEQFSFFGDVTIVR
jgi:gliding motility-associated-like protein